jgi:hypothetical protein
MSNPPFIKKQNIKKNPFPLLLYEIVDHRVLETFFILCLVEYLHTLHFQSRKKNTHTYLDVQS